MFILAAFIGWLYEVVCTYALFQIYVDRGVLHLPLCPIYGFGILLLYLIFRKVKNPFAVFAGSAVITTVIEYITSVAAEYFFHVELWSYEPWPLNYQGRISLISSCIFGLMAVIFLKLAVPLIERVYQTKAKTIISLFVTLLYLFCIIWELRFIFG